MARDRHRASTLVGAAGLILVAAAGGVVLPGAAAVTVPELTVTSTAPGAAGTVSPAVSPVTGDPAGAGSGPGLAIATRPVGDTTDGATPTTPGPARTPADGATGRASDTAAPAGPTRAVQQSGVPTTSTTARAMPVIGPSPVLHLTVPAIGVDAGVLPVDSQPTGRFNRWGGPIYRQIDFPVDQFVRQWVRRGDPNSLPADRAAGRVKAFDRVVLYGHASDIGNRLVFQDLSAMRPGDMITARTALGVFSYRTTMIATRAKTRLDDLAALYDYPEHGAKEIALVACLPDTTNNVVVIGTLVAARPVG